MSKKDQIFAEVFEIFGEELPDRLIFSATTANTVTVPNIRKHFKSWSKFVAEYTTFCIQNRNEKASANIVHKEIKNSPITKAGPSKSKGEDDV